MIITILRLKSSGLHKAELLQALHSLMRPARAEKGFLTSQILLDVDDASAIRYEEWWESGEELESQVRSARFTRLLALMESATERPSLEFHSVAETRGLEYVAAVRGERLNV